jgi:hypothetical protein
VSMVAYHFDGVDAVISCRRSTSKFVNAARDPRVVLTVADGRRYLAVAGEAEAVTHGDRLVVLTLRLQASLEPVDANALQSEIDTGLEHAGRGILRVVPESIVGRI